MKVWVTATKFHAGKGCPEKYGSEPREVDIEDASFLDPCRLCYPKLKTTRRTACEVCSPMMLMPCRHNGGVKVVTTRGAVWTWPERAVFLQRPEK